VPSLGNLLCTARGTSSVPTSGNLLCVARRSSRPLSSNLARPAMGRVARPDICANDELIKLNKLVP
jgi:hypothetical protein